MEVGTIWRLRWSTPVGVEVKIFGQRWVDVVSWGCDEQSQRVGLSVLMGVEIV